MSYDAALEAWKVQTAAVTPGPVEPVLRSVRQSRDPQLVSGWRVWLVRACLGTVVAS